MTTASALLTQGVAAAAALSCPACAAPCMAGANSWCMPQSLGNNEASQEHHFSWNQGIRESMWLQIMPREGWDCLGWCKRTLQDASAGGDGGWVLPWLLPPLEILKGAMRSSIGTQGWVMEAAQTAAGSSPSGQVAPRCLKDPTKTHKSKCSTLPQSLLSFSADRE